MNTNRTDQQGFFLDDETNDRGLPAPEDFSGVAAGNRAADRAGVQGLVPVPRAWAAASAAIDESEPGLAILRDELELLVDQFGIHLVTEQLALILIGLKLDEAIANKGEQK